MVLTAFEKKRVSRLLDEYCEKRVPERVRHQVRMEYKFRGDTVTLFEVRAHYRIPEDWIEIPFAQFRRAKEGGLWKLYCRDRNRRWWLFDPHPESKTIEELLGVVEEDSTGIFYG